MGTFSPSRIYTDEMAKECMENIFLPTMNAMNAEGRTFKGVLYFGLMSTKDGVKVIEYNCRFGDPETQVVLPRLKSDLLEIFEAVADERLAEVEIEWKDGGCVCVVAASGGYPEKYESGKEITGIGEAEALGDIVVFHAGTKLDGDKLLTAGGRVLGITAVADSLDNAIKHAYEGVKKVHFDKMHYRTDIGIKKQ